MTRWTDIARAQAGDDYATTYAERFRRMAARGQDVHGEAALVTRLVEPPARVLDAGCGTGRIASRLDELGYDVVGVDVDAAMLAVARAEAPGLDWREGDLATLDLGETFDLVLLAGNILPLLEPGTLGAVAGRLAAHAAPGGRVVCGFGLDADHLPGDCPVTPLAEVEAAFAAVGLVAVASYATWDGEPYDGGGYVVTVHGTGERMKVVVLTGAGISAESGVPTFRDADGLWEGHRVEDVATPEAYDAAPSVVHAFYDARRAALAGVDPNPAHHALARLEERLGDDLLVVTQNIDDLHERAGSQRVLHMHGELLSALCRGCDQRSPWADQLSDLPPCPRCGVTELRPDVVWFGEIPYEMDRIFGALETCDLFVSIGTSGAVYPAAGFVRQAASAGARTLELNLVPSDGSHFFHDSRHGPASVLVPAWVDELATPG